MPMGLFALHKYDKRGAAVNQPIDIIMNDLAHQFRRAHDLDMLCGLEESNSLIVATFRDTTKNFIIDAVVKHINIKYGTHVHAARSELNPKIVEVWHKKICT